MRPSIFEYSDYKKYTLDLIKSYPKKGRGELGRVAIKLRMHSSRISHVFRGESKLTAEQACDMAEHFNLTSAEQEYFLALVDRERAGTTSLRRAHSNRIERLRNEALQLSTKLAKDREFTDIEKNIFYSNWFYSAIRLACTVPGADHPAGISRFLGLPLELVNEALKFLISVGLCSEKNGRLEIGARRTHLNEDSPFIPRFHSNWRFKAMERYPTLSPRELAYSSPMAISREDALKIHFELSRLIETIHQGIERSDPEVLMCLNIDWIRLGGG